MFNSDAQNYFVKELLQLKEANILLFENLNDFKDKGVETKQKDSKIETKTNNLENKND